MTAMITTLENLLSQVFTNSGNWAVPATTTCLGLETALREVLNAETEHVIELHAVLGEHSNADKTTEKGISFEETARVLQREGKY
ncbi:hypothetical protein PRIPAC_86875 [Pristionchus pacificus]|uniref:Uncharacterized protein n=1 Tax=Pristionchus pacificus TaxID=54126 RepID=A0A2A6BTR6_PRIPA|nr:hypothetical protein PRIPAC_86875 [Pristionchus pacificus]|eukprot:PDM69372.1 hypothetical protein PRIPAC_47674 [Pristionchus pacificus]